MPAKPEKISVKIRSHGIKSDVLPFTPLIKLLEKYDLRLHFPCGGNATCGKCMIRFLTGAPEAAYYDRLYLTPAELKSGFRLACQCVITEDAVLDLPEAEIVQDVIQAARIPKKPVDPLVTGNILILKKPDLERLKSDEEIIRDGVGSARKINISLLQKIPDRLRAADFNPVVIQTKDEIIDIRTEIEIPDIYGVAIDIGSTTLATSLNNLKTGESIALQTAANPQVKYGDDLISRLTYIANNPESEKILHTALIYQLNEMLRKMVGSTGIDPNQIYTCVVSGNVIMNHLFMGVNPRYVGYAPYTPVFRDIKKIKAHTAGLNIYPEADVWVMPNIGGYVGGDIISDMICAGFGNERSETKLLIDIGTNCEIVLETPHERLAASSPAGPALEGACIRFGMRAESGAIFDVTPGGQIQTVRNKPARGICGSGVFHLMDRLYRAGVFNLSGKILTASESGNGNNYHITKFESVPAVMIAAVENGAERDIFLTQGDIREFQLARSAIVAAWKMLSDIAGITPQEIDQVYIAGAFGNFIRPDAAIGLGLVPVKDANKIHFIGNGALEGGRITLMEQNMLLKAQELRQTTRFVELAGQPHFQEIYVENMHFPK